jgi:hypothetical protein
MSEFMENTKEVKGMAEQWVSKANLRTRHSGSYNTLLKIDSNSRSNFFLVTSPLESVQVFCV